VLKAAGETEFMLELDEGDVFQLLTEERTAADIIKDSAIGEDSDGKLGEIQEAKQTKKLSGFSPRANYTDLAAAACRRS
jgi:hypothetical protein